MILIIFLILIAPIEIFFDLQSLFQSSGQSTGVVVSITNFFNSVNPPGRTAEFMIMANPTVLISDGISLWRPPQFGWHKVSTEKRDPLPVITGSFYLILIILLFFIFYQNARSGSEDWLWQGFTVI